MFAKPYKLKSNTTLKNSEKKHLAQRIQNEFPSCSEEKVKELVPIKSSCICMKVVRHSGDLVNVYSVDSVPMIIETEEQLLPTVCALWKVPDMVPALIVNSLVLSKIQGGAPLYLPGVVIPTNGVGFPKFHRNSLVAVCTNDNAAAGVVGRALMSSADMLFREGGVCLETYQVFGDQLCKDNKFSKVERPRAGPASYSQGDGTEGITEHVGQLTLVPVIKEEWPSLDKRPAPETVTQPAAAPSATPHNTVINEPKLIQAEPMDLEDELSEHTDDVIITDDVSPLDEPLIPTDMDGLLRYCLLSFLKLQAKSTEYPFKTNLLYKCMMQLSPPNTTIDVKKSSYKKLSKFLEAMQQEGLLEVREIERGVSGVWSVQTAHPAVRAHLPAHEAPAPAHDQPRGDYVPPTVREMFCVTAALLDVLAPVKKGTALTAGEVRTRLTEYVKCHNLNNTQVKGAVTLDPALAKICSKTEGESVKWDVLMTSAQSRMTPSTEMRFDDGTITLTKSKLEPIKMQVANRSGNKKVTLVSNLESFGFNLLALSHVCQNGVAASSKVTRTPGAACDQLMIQGDQTHFVAKLLIEKYGLPKKYVEGADKALNKKK